MWTRRAFLAAATVAPFTRASRIRAARYDLVVRGGRVIDPARRVDRTADVVDARGKLVTPGLIDLHVHVAAPQLTPGALLRDGVTSMVDGGSAGADNIDALVRVAEAAPNRVRIFLNIARTGVASPGELLNIAAADVDAARQAITTSKRFGARVRRPGRCR